MLIKENHTYQWPVLPAMNVSDWVEQSLLDHDVPDRADQAQANAESAQRCLGLLIQKLAEKGLLNAIEISEVVCGYPRDVDFVEPEPVEKEPELVLLKLDGE